MTAAVASGNAGADAATPVVVPAARRRRAPTVIASLSLAAALASSVTYLVTRGQESTDDAEVEGRVMNVAARVSGQVLRVRVEDNQIVQAGDVLVELDPADFEAKAEAARGDLAAARASADGARAALRLAEKTAPASLTEARGGMTAASFSVVAAHAAIDQAKADVVAAESRKALALLNLNRSRALLASDAVPVAEVDSRQTEFDATNAAVEQARARQAAAEASLAGSSGGVVLATGRLDAARTAPEQIDAARAAVALADARIAQAEAASKLAELAVSYTTVRATRRGVVSRRSVEEGQTVSPDRQLMAVVPLDDVWVVANFKEDQLGDIKPGEPAMVRLDTYGRRDFHGHVESIAGGTGARFALLPPDNATGNFVKVVQRVPVLIRLDGAPIETLRPGMSADVTVRTR
ncbi:MAG TPA: HlyD family secretion protein [Polyangiaceae bacterium]|jgi:membrane fusion protein (multidrug efflux system)|nr:HlyD family secretion protein [Polyangiaceae bacterium]